MTEPVPKIFVGTGTGFRYRRWEYEQWCREHGEFNSLTESHGWHAWFGVVDAEPEYCQAVVMDAELRCDCDDHYASRCQNLGDLVYRGACRLCDWEAAHFWDDENLAAEDALDHAWPGWRDLRVVLPIPDDAKKRAVWVAQVNEIYPPGWLEQGGPIITMREYMGHRHVPGRTPFGGYDVGRIRPGSEQEWKERLAFVQADLTQKLAEEIG